MIVSEVVTRVLRQFGDEAAVQIQEPDIIRWINDVQREISIQNELSQATGTMTPVVGQNEYSFPVDMLAMRSLYYNGSRLKYLSRQEYDEYINKSDPNEVQTGTPSYYSRWGNKFIVYPRPDTALANAFKLLYHSRPVDVTTTGDTLSLPLEYHNRVVEYCLQKAYETDEDWDAAAAKSTQFDAGLSILKENQQNPDKQYYPTVTTLPEDQW